VLDCSFFDQQISDGLQHVAVLFEISAVFLLVKDFRNYTNDAKRLQRAATAGAVLPRNRRSTEFWIAVVVGGFAILMELYQLATQYWHC